MMTRLTYQEYGEGIQWESDRLRSERLKIG